MGLLSFLGKAVGSVAKAGLGVVTGGISTQILDVAGGILKKKKQAVNQQNLYDAAGLTDNYRPPARRTESVMPGGAIIPAYRGVSGTPADVEVAPRPRKRRPRQRLAAARAPRKAARRAGTTRARRAPPRGGLDLKAMSSAWRAQGKPSSWQDWIASNPIYAR